MRELMLVVMAMSLLGAAVAADLGAGYAGSDEVVFYADFEAGPGAWKATVNPYQWGTQFELVPGGVAGQAWKGSTKYGYLGFDGRNIPVAAGTVAFAVKAANGNVFADGKKRCFLALTRTIEGMAGEKEKWDSRGLALSLRKTEQNTLDLIAHVGGDSWMRMSKPAVLVSVDASKLNGSAWHRLAVSWDFAARKVWLVVDGNAQEGAIPAEITVAQEYLGMVLGNTEDYILANQEPADCLLDEVVVFKVAYPAAAAVMKQNKPLTAARPPVPTRVAQATLFAADPNLSQLEQVARQHLDLLVEEQRHGAWCLAIKWPSLAQFTAKFRLPEPRNAIWLSKDGHTAFGATQLLFASVALGDERYLEAAKKTGDMYLAVQDPKLGFWVHGYFAEQSGYVPATADPLIQDHCQSGPIFLLSYLHKVTGERKYLDGAKRGVEFLIKCQNPNGSWSHHYSVAKGVAVASNGSVGGGEVNDYGTSAPVATLLQMYRMTGEEKYKQAALRGADWLVKAFIDNGKVAGWAAQYDDKDQPIPARHFEPASVTNYAPRWAAMGLIAAYEVAQDRKYLEPLEKTLAWMDANKEEGGWWWDYDVQTGRPIHMHQNKIYFMDDPAQVQAYVEVTGGKAPERGNWMNIDGIRWEVKNALTGPKTPKQPTAEELKKFVEASGPAYVTTYIESKTQPFNREAGLFTWESESGQATSLVRHQVVRFCDLLMRARAVRGEVPADHPYFKRVEAGVTWNKVLDK